MGDDVRVSGGGGGEDLSGVAEGVEGGGEGDELGDEEGGFAEAMDEDLEVRLVQLH